MRTKAQIHDQRDFMKKVKAKIAELGLLYTFVAKNVKLSPARLSQFIGNYRQLPLRYKQKLAEYLKIS